MIRENILLTGLEDRPADDAAEEMAAFDALPTRIKRDLAEIPFYFSARKVKLYCDRNGEMMTRQLITASIANERRRFTKQRADALSWAGSALRIRVPPRVGEEVRIARELRFDASVVRAGTIAVVVKVGADGYTLDLPGPPFLAKVGLRDFDPVR